MPVEKPLPRSVWLFYLGTLLNGMTFFIPIWAIYIEQGAGSTTAVAFIIAIQSFASVLFEVPTGVIGDLFGRKRTMIISWIVYFSSLVFFAIGGSLVMFVLYAVLSALGGSLASGTDTAFIYDTLKEKKMEHRYKKVMGTINAIWPFGAIIGSIVGGYLASISMSFAVMATFIPAGLAFAITFFFREPKYEKERHRSVVRHMFSSWKEVVMRGQLILLFVAFGFLMYGLSESIHLLKPIFLESKGISFALLGYVFAVSYALSSAGHYFSHAISERIGDKRALLLSVLIEPILLIAATYAVGVTAALFLVIPSALFGLRNPVVSHLINLEVASSKRATVLSIYNLMMQLGKVVFAPFIGYLADVYTISTAFRISAFLMFSAILLLIFVKVKEH